MILTRMMIPLRSLLMLQLLVVCVLFSNRTTGTGAVSSRNTIGSGTTTTTTAMMMMMIMMVDGRKITAATTTTTTSNIRPRVAKVASVATTSSRPLYSNNNNHHHDHRGHRRITTTSSSSSSVTPGTNGSTTAVTTTATLKRTTPTMTLQQQQQRSLALALARQSPLSPPSPPSSIAELSQPMMRRLLLRTTTVISIISISYVAYHHRQVWLPFFNKELIQQRVLSVLQHIQPPIDATMIQQLQSISIYVIGMMIWEFCGLSTIPVETAAGMVFSYPVAALSSIVGKVIGATIAFQLGRTYLQQSIQQNTIIQKNTIFQILLNNNNNNNKNQQKSSSSSFQTALCMKFSCFPELIKNFGSSCISSISIFHFMMVTLLHGGFYTCIWTYLGYDTTQHLIDSSLPPNRIVQILVLTAMITGCIITPLVMAWWIRDLQYNAATQLLSSSKGRNTIMIPQMMTSKLRQVQDQWQTNVRPQLQSKIQHVIQQQQPKQRTTNANVVRKPKSSLSSSSSSSSSISRSTTSTTISQIQQQQQQQWFIVRLLKSRSLAEIWIVLLVVLFIISS